MGRDPIPSIVSPDDQSVMFVELFFDLVFVFSVTQVVGFLHHHLDWTGAGQSVLVFWLVWCAWTQFTWALNAANTTHPAVELGTLAATAVAFFMAVALPGSWGAFLPGSRSPSRSRARRSWPAPSIACKCRP